VDDTLRVVVCVKAVPDPELADKLRIDPGTKTLDRRDIPLVVNPHDRYAIEAALQLKQRHGGTVTILSMGPPPASSVVRESLALGADRGILLTDKALAGADAYATAFTLSKGIQKIGTFDVILCGMASSDGSTEWVGPELAALLDVPVVTRVFELVESQGSWWEVKAAFEDGYRLVHIQLPAVLTVTRDLNTPRALSFSGIIKAKKLEIEHWGMDDLGVSEKDVGLKGSPTFTSDFKLVEAKREVEMLTGTREEMADQLTRKLVEAGAI
jgi:electron transfer flavoprotein beta subunit